MAPEASTPATDPFFRRRADMELHFTDTRGGPTTRDITKRQDPDEAMTTYIRSDLHTTDQIDTWGREGAAVYLAEEAVRLVTSDDEGKEVTGKQVILINGAPRDGTTENGSDFYAVRVNNLLIIAHATALSGIKDQIRGDVYRVVGFTPTQQFRSSIASKASWQPKKLEPVPDALEHIPEPPEYPMIAYVDRFGNVRLSVSEQDAFERKLAGHSYESGGGRAVLLQVDGGPAVEFTVQFAMALGAPSSAKHKLYRDPDRGGRLALAYGWKKEDSVEDKVRHSAFYALSGACEENKFQPEEEEFISEGAQLKVLPPPNHVKTVCKSEAAC